MATNKTDSLLTQLKAELDANAALECSVVVETQEVISDTTFEDSLAAALEANGSAVAVYIPSFDNDLPNVEGPSPTIRVLCDVWFNPVHTNGTRDGITVAMEKVITTLHHFIPAILNRAMIVTQGNPTIRNGFFVYPILLQQTMVFDQ
jgi:hypothetical protein